MRGSGQRIPPENCHHCPVGGWDPAAVLAIEGSAGCAAAMRGMRPGESRGRIAPRRMAGSQRLAAGGTNADSSLDRDHGRPQDPGNSLLLVLLHFARNHTYPQHHPERFPSTAPMVKHPCPSDRAIREARCAGLDRRFPLEVGRSGCTCGNPDPAGCPYWGQARPAARADGDRPRAGSTGAVAAGPGVRAGAPDSTVRLEAPRCLPFSPGSLARNRMRLASRHGPAAPSPRPCGLSNAGMRRTRR